VTILSRRQIAKLRTGQAVLKNEEIQGAPFLFGVPFGRLPTYDIKIKQRRM
jgi:hypothetical protein